ncbi:MAG: MerR family transcriptional regulator [Acidimicrobiia bacterium]|nr:MerR family transcriptional regulator [Acidimicrobiia bacterium]
MEDRWRVEDLARLAELSVDTIRFYQKRRLLDAPTREGRVAWYGSEHLDSLNRIRDLQGRGFPLALIGRIVRGEMDPADAPLAAAVLAAAGTDEAPSTTELLSIADLASRTGVPQPLIEAIVAEGLLAPRSSDGEPLFAASDTAVVEAGLRLVAGGLPIPELLALAREHHAATRATAERAVAMFDEHVRTPLRLTDLTDDEKADRLVAAFGELLPAITALVTHHFRQVLLAVAREHMEDVGGAAEIAAARAEDARLAESEWTP